MRIGWVNLDRLGQWRHTQLHRSAPYPGYVICCDYGEAWAWRLQPEGPAPLGPNCGMGRCWDGEPRLPSFLVKAFAAWQERFERLDTDRIPLGVDRFEDFSWRAFHADGLRLAKRLKRRLGPKVTVIYSRPWEDLSGLGPRRLLIADDLTVARHVHTAPEAHGLSRDEAR